MNEQKVLKIITPNICPHCGKKMIISLKTMAPWIDWTLKEEDVEKAKKTVISMVKESTTINKEEKKSLMTWLTSKDTLFGPDDIEAVMQQILNKPDESTISNENKNK